MKHSGPYKALDPSIQSPSDEFINASVFISDCKVRRVSTLLICHWKSGMLDLPQSLSSLIDWFSRLTSKLVELQDKGFSRESGLDQVRVLLDGGVAAIIMDPVAIQGRPLPPPFLTRDLHFHPYHQFLTHHNNNHPTAIDEEQAGNGSLNHWQKRDDENSH